jgi:hypothetical protein
VVIRLAALIAATLMPVRATLLIAVMPTSYERRNAAGEYRHLEDLSAPNQCDQPRGNQLRTGKNNP